MRGPWTQRTSSSSGQVRSSRVRFIPFESIECPRLKFCLPSYSSFLFVSLLLLLALYVSALVWSVYAFIAVLKLNLDYLIICALALTLTGSNIVGFVKCSKGATPKRDTHTPRTAPSIASMRVDRAASRSSLVSLPFACTCLPRPLEARSRLSNFANQATKTAVSAGIGNFFHLG